MLNASSGLTRSSASMLKTHSPRASPSARFFCAPKPGQLVLRSTRAPRLTAMSQVASLLPESSTTHSSANATLLRQSAICRASFRVMTMTDRLMADMNDESGPCVSGGIVGTGGDG